ncbi:hypothetical protein Adt_47331 [Abeliophyllum distichum]|uniref:Uncharacterized protein n=1 Tax=Abeliophyllum distichum TaxID=126358 RepID=A0ABD1NUN7_9LAMI
MFIPPSELLDDDDLKWYISIHKDTTLCVICVPRVRCSTSHIDVAAITCNIDASTTPTYTLEGGLIGRDNVQYCINVLNIFIILRRIQNFENDMDSNVEKTNNANTMEPKCFIHHLSNPNYVTQNNGIILNSLDTINT